MPDSRIWHQVERFAHLLVNLEQKWDQALIRQLDLKTQRGVQTCQTWFHKCLVYQVAQLHELEGALRRFHPPLQCVNDKLN